jgi:hypothetical protein
MKLGRQIATPLALIMSFCLAGTATAGDLVPIHGQGSITVTGQTIDPATGNVILTTDVAGEVSHLGHTTGAGVQTLFAPDYIFFTFDVTLVAANGDEFFMVFGGNFIDGAGDSVGTSSITGGTGRFAGASGRGTLLSFNDAALFQIDGEISTFGSDK